MKSVKLALLVGFFILGIVATLVTVSSISGLNADGVSVIGDKISKDYLKSLSPLKRAEHLIEGYDSVISNSKDANIDTTGFESISAKAKRKRDELKDAIENNDTVQKERLIHEIKATSPEFHEEIQRIRAQQDKRDVERMMELVDGYIQLIENASNRLDARGVDVGDLRTGLDKIREHSKLAEGYYAGQKYREAEEELRKARQEVSTVVGETKSLLDAQGLDF